MFRPADTEGGGRIPPLSQRTRAESHACDSLSSSGREDAPGASSPSRMPKGGPGPSGPSPRAASEAPALTGPSSVRRDVPRNELDDRQHEKRAQHAEHHETEEHADSNVRHRRDRRKRSGGARL